jgi:hypothetical protein
MANQWEARGCQFLDKLIWRMSRDVMILDCQKLDSPKNLGRGLRNDTVLGPLYVDLDQIYDSIDTI